MKQKYKQLAIAGISILSAILTGCGDNTKGDEMKLGEETKEAIDNAKDATGESKEKMEATLETLAEKRQDLNLQIEKMKNATSETRGDVKVETQKKWNDFTEELQKVKNEFTSS